MPTLNLNGCSFNYLDLGRGPAVVLLHGFPLDLRIWQPVADRLQSTCRVILIDLRGFGASTPAAAFTMESAADDVHALLQKLNAVPCVLGGLSMGGYVAMAYVTRHAATLKGLILSDTKAEADTPESKAGRLKMIDLVRAQGAKAVADQMLPKMSCDYTAQNQPQIIQQLRQIMEACPPDTTAHAQQAMHDRPNYLPVLQTLPVPGLMTCGQDDAISPLVMARQMAAAMPQGTLATIPNAGHMAPMEQPEAVAQAIQKFIQSL